MIQFKRGQIFSSNDMLKQGSKTFLKLNNHLIEALVKESLMPGEKLVVTSVSSKQILLRPYSKVFKDFALSDLLKNLGLPSNDLAKKLLQTALVLDIPLKKEKFQKFLRDFQSLEIDPKWLSFFLKKEKAFSQAGLFKKSQLGLEQIPLLMGAFLNLSDNEEIFLPIDPDGSFVSFSAEEEQNIFQMLLDFSALNMVYIKGWASKKEKEGEVFIYLMPYFDIKSFDFLKDKMKEMYKDFKFYIQHLNSGILRRVDGFF